MTASGPFLVGSTIAGYRLLAKLGEGGMGAVYLARHAEQDRNVAVKVLHRRHGSNPAMVSRFVTEARAATGARVKCSRSST
jgi:serine/threonine-protein kinase